MITSAQDCVDKPATAPSFLLYPGWPATRLPYDATYAAGQGPGWLATFSSPGYCFRTAAAASPRVLRARLCLESGRPVVSNDGTKAVITEGDQRTFGHNRPHLFDTRTGLRINTPALPPGFYEPFAWEGPNRYLVYARDFGATVILRCFLNGACRRAVTASPSTEIVHSPAAPSIIR